MKWTLLLFALTLALVDCSPKHIWIPYDGTNKDVYQGMWNINNILHFILMSAC